MVWKTIADATLELSKLTLYANPNMVLRVVRAVCDTLAEGTTEPALIPGFISVAELIMKYTRQDGASLDGVDLHWLAIACYHTRVGLTNNDQVAEGSAQFDLSIATHSIISRLKKRQNEEKLSDVASHAMVDALKHSPGNGFYWNALGNIEFLRDPKLAQHAYIRALELDHKVGGRFMCLLTTLKSLSRIPYSGPTWVSFISIMEIQSWPTKHSIEHKFQIQIILKLGLDKPWSQ